MRIAGSLLSLFALVSFTLQAAASEIVFIEDFALATNREDAIKQLIPGTEEFYYYQALNQQNMGQYDKVRETLAAWIKRHGHTGLTEEIRNRQALLDYDTDPKGALNFIKNQMGLSFNHAREIMGIHLAAGFYLHADDTTVRRFQHHVHLFSRRRAEINRAPVGIRARRVDGPESPAVCENLRHRGIPLLPLDQIDPPRPGVGSGAAEGW